MRTIKIDEKNKQILEAVKAEKPQTEMATITGLSKQVIYQRIQRLIKAGYIVQRYAFVVTDKSTETVPEIPEESAPVA